MSGNNPANALSKNVVPFDTSLQYVASLRMKAFNLFGPILNAILGIEAKRRLHAAITLVPIPMHITCLATLWYLVGKGQISTTWATAITVACILSYTAFYTMVRSGYSSRFNDPAMALPHAYTCQVLYVLTYMAMGPYQALAYVLMAQLILGAMLRLKPKQVQHLGGITVLMVLLAFTLAHVLGLNPISVMRSATHLVVGCASLLMLSLVGRWISDLRVDISDQGKKLRVALATVQTLATQDQLTGLWNRHMMLEKLSTEKQMSDRHGTHWCVALIDLDHFKQINDRFGHAQGDAVLKTFADLARTHLRVVDIIGRWGGEEFLVIFPRTGVEEALASLQRLRLACQEWRQPEHPDLVMNFSAGLTQAISDEALDQIIDRADKTMYMAKAAGRGRVMWAPPISSLYEPQPVSTTLAEVM